MPSAPDHAGVDLKETIVELLKAWGHEVTDMGTETKNSCDYSDYANAVASSIADGTNERGILICRSGIGMSIAANRWVGVRAALCRTAPAAALSPPAQQFQPALPGFRLRGQ